MGKEKGVMPDYEDDIFISYTHVDNDKYAKDHQGWVDYMHERLELRLFQLLGEKPAIWRDIKLRHNDIVSNALIMKLQKIAILVAVLSPRYVNSEWCLRELAEFYRKIDDSNPQPFQTNAPIFKVVKTPVDENKYPEQLRELLGYKFYDEGSFSGRPVEFSHEISFSTFPKFIERVNDLAWDIKVFIQSLQETPSGRLVLPVGKTVYLATTGSDASEERDEIRRELQSYGYRVLPYRDFPSDPDKLKEVITEDLRVSCLSIHIVGESYDATELSSQSLVRLQHELAIDRGRESNFAQVIWIPRRLKVTDESQQRLIDALRHDGYTHRHIEIFEDRLEDLKTNLRFKLKSLEEFAGKSLDVNPDPHVKGHSKTIEPLEIYLINDYEDYEATDQLRKFLDQQNIEVLQIVTTSEERQAEAALRLHRDYLKDCHGVIVFYGRASDLWMKQKVNELHGDCGGRSTELLGKAVYLSDPVTAPKKNFSSQKVTVIREQDEFPSEDLIAFLQKLRSTNV